MSKQISDRLRRGIDIRCSKHHHPIEHACQRYCSGIADNYMSVLPMVGFDPSASVDRSFGADLNPDYLARGADCIDQIRKRSTGTASCIEYAASSLQLERLYCSPP